MDNNMEEKKVDRRKPENCDGSDGHRKFLVKRRMAWVSLIMMIIVTFGLMFYIPESRLPKITEPIAWCYMSFASIIGFFFGAQTWASIKK